MTKEALQTDSYFHALNNEPAGDHSRRTLGGKAVSLYRLREWGLTVPDFCIVTADAFREVLQLNHLLPLCEWLDNPGAALPLPFEQIQARLADCKFSPDIERRISVFMQKHTKETFAVRSSGTLEDGEIHSFAGLYKTVLNVKNRDDIFNAIRSCWAAFFEERVRHYIDDAGLSDPIGLALIIQCLVPAEISGVMFTVDPIRGTDREMLIEACFGLGEALVAGDVTPDRYRYDWYNDHLTGKEIACKESQCVRLDHPPFTEIRAVAPPMASEPALSETQVRELVRIGLDIQDRSRRPVDIEWAWFDGRFHILQSRPITQISYTGIAGEWTTADFRDGGVSATVCTPYMASLYKSVIEVTMPAYLAGLGILKPGRKDTWMRCFFSRPYWNLGAVKHYLSQIPDFNERIFDEGLGISPVYEGDGMVSKLTPRSLFLGLRALYRIKSNCRRRLKDCPSFFERQRQRLRELASMDFDGMSDEALYGFTDKFLREEYFENEAAYFYFIYDNANLNSLFKDKVAKFVSDKSGFPSLLAGLQGVSHLAQMEGLWDLRRNIDQIPGARDYWQGKDVEDIVAAYAADDRANGLDSLRDYLDTYGHHATRELDLTVPRYKEDLAYVIGQVKDVLHQPLHNDPVHRSRGQLAPAGEAQDRMLRSAPVWRRRTLRRYLRQVRHFLWWREELRDLSTKYYYYVRKITLAVEKRLLKNGFIEQCGDVFFLERDNLIDVMNGKVPPQRCQHIIHKNRRYYNSFGDYGIPDEIGHRYGNDGKTAREPAAPITDLNLLAQGVAGSAGLTTATARVIANITDAHRIQVGDILVTRCTDPGWTPKFALLSAVVTETGGILSHAAVICREYGIPAVLAVKNATRLIRDGETLSVDGNRGILLRAGKDELRLGEETPLTEHNSP